LKFFRTGAKNIPTQLLISEYPAGFPSDDFQNIFKEDLMNNWKEK